MKITSIKQQQKRSDRYSIYVDGKYSFSLSEVELANSRLHKDQELSLSEVKKIQSTAVLDKAYDRSLRYLAIRPRSQWEIEYYLKRKGYDNVLVRPVLAKLKKIGLVDDVKFAKQWVEWRLNTGGRSRRQLQAELYKKRLTRDVIDDTLAEIDNDTELEQIKALIARKAKLSQYQDHQKLIAFLARRGFAYRLIKQALAELK